MSFFVYIMTNKPYGTLYVGQTDDLWTRVGQHKSFAADSFTKKYKLDKLAYYEAHGMRGQATQREANIKAWQREWKINLIEGMNPKGDDLAFHLNTQNHAAAQWTPACAGEVGL